MSFGYAKYSVTYKVVLLIAETLFTIICVTLPKLSDTKKATTIYFPDIGANLRYSYKS